MFAFPDIDTPESFPKRVFFSPDTELPAESPIRVLRSASVILNLPTSDRIVPSNRRLVSPCISAGVAVPVSILLFALFATASPPVPPLNGIT